MPTQNEMLMAIGRLKSKPEVVNMAAVRFPKPEVVITYMYIVTF